MQYQSLTQIGDVISQAEGNFWCKNVTGEYFGIGKGFVDFSGLPTKDEIVGKTDYQLPWAAAATTLEHNDRKTQIRNFLYLDQERVITADHKSMNFLVAKFPVYSNKNQLLGTVGCAELIPPSLNVTNSTTVISEKIIELSHELFSVLKKLPRQIHIDHKNQYSLVINRQRIFFTERELYCLGYLVLGKGAKESGQLLNISAKTVEYYLQRAKDKLKCYHRSQLITLLFKNQVVDQLVQMVESRQTA